MSALFGPPLRVTALVPRRKLHGDRCAALWAFVTEDGRHATTFAMSIDDAAEWCKTLFPATTVDAHVLRSEVGTPFV